jgi:hypothetical protein
VTHGMLGVVCPFVCASACVSECTCVCMRARVHVLCACISRLHAMSGLPTHGCIPISTPPPLCTACLLRCPSGSASVASVTQPDDGAPGGEGIAGAGTALSFAPRDASWLRRATSTGGAPAVPSGGEGDGEKKKKKKKKGKKAAGDGTTSAGACCGATCGCSGGVKGRCETC